MPSIKGYLSKMKVLTEILISIEDLRAEALMLDENGVALRHTGDARNVLKLRFLMTERTTRLLFAAISIDGSLPKERGGAARNNAIIK